METRAKTLMILYYNETFNTKEKWNWAVLNGFTTTFKSHFEHDGDLLEAVKMSFEQAKAMHKDEIENAYWDGGQWVPTSGSQCEEYYNETFNTKEKWEKN